jgi:hypothetical protein
MGLLRGLLGVWSKSLLEMNISRVVSIWVDANLEFRRSSIAGAQSIVCRLRILGLH